MEPTIAGYTIEKYSMLMMICISVCSVYASSSSLTTLFNNQSQDLSLSYFTALLPVTIQDRFEGSSNPIANRMISFLMGPILSTAVSPKERAQTTGPKSVLYSFESLSTVPSMAKFGKKRSLEYGVNEWMFPKIIVRERVVVQDVNFLVGGWNNLNKN